MFPVTDVELRPKPIQDPRIPIVTAEQWPSKRPIQRGARWDGITPIGQGFPKQLPIEEIRGCFEYYHSLREDDPGDVFIRLSPESSRLEEIVATCENLGVTWILVGDIPPADSKTDNIDRSRVGPPLR